MKPQRSTVFFEPTMVVQFRPACANCGAVHPLTLGSDSETCLSCGERVAQPGPGFTVPAMVVGHSPRALLAKAWFWAAKTLARWARKVDGDED